VRLIVRGSIGALVLSLATGSTRVCARDLEPPVHDAEAAPAEEDVYEAVAEVEAPPRQATERKLDAEQLARVPGTSGDPIKAVDVLPGVSRSNDGEPILRGAAEHESTVFIDGTRVPFLYHFGGLRSVVHPRLIEQVALYPGNFSTRYGRATGGVVEARLREPRSDAWHGELELSLLDSSALLEGPLTENLSFAVAARRSNIDFVFDSFVPEGTFNVLVAPVYWDYQGQLSYRLGQHGRVRLSALGSRDQTTLVFADPSAENAALRGDVGGSVEFHRLQLEYQDRFAGVSQDVQVSVGKEALRQVVGPNSQAYFDVLDLGARGEWTVPVSAQVELVTGLDVEAQAFTGAYRGSPAPASEGSLDGPDNVADQITVDRTSFWLVHPAAYLEARYFPLERLLILPGIRVDYYEELDALSVDPRLSQRLTLGEAVTLKSAVGWYSQPPEYYESLAGVGNPKVDPYHALHLSAGAEFRVSDALFLDLEGFYKRLSHRVVATEGSVPPHFINDGRGRILGLEAGASYRQHDGLAAQFSYTLSRSERQDRDDPWRLFDRDQTHVLSLALGYPLGAGFYAGARFRFITGNPVTEVQSSSYDAGSDVYYPLFGKQNAARDPAFHQLDVRLEKTFGIGPGTLGVYLDVQNVYAAENPEGFVYSYDYRTRQAATGSPFFPNLGLRGEL